jgi:hypothetical protein
VIASGGIGRLMELLPHPLADASQAPMFRLLEDQSNVFQGGLFGGLRSWIGLEEGQGGRLLE